MTAGVPGIERRLHGEPIAWLATVRADGSPHVTPVWFVYRHGIWWVGCAATSVKARNCRARPAVALTLQDGRAPVVAEGIATVRTAGFPVPVVEAFAEKYHGWDVRADGAGARALIEVPTTRWLLRGIAR